jgi:hypothetical protein
LVLFPYTSLLHLPTGYKRSANQPIESINGRFKKETDKKYARMKPNIFLKEKYGLSWIKDNHKKKIVFLKKKKILC